MRLIVLLFGILVSPLASADEATQLPLPIDAFIADMAIRHGFEEKLLRGQFDTFTPLPTVLRLIAPPKHPGQRSWQRYRARFLTRQRIAGGVAFWAEHHAVVERASARFGIPPEIIVAIIGVETEYGRNTGGFKVFQALATLAFHYPPRADFFRGELEQLLLLARENRLDPTAITGSYAGAIGIPQFMPGSQRRYAVDFDDDGRIDLSGSPDDAIGSVASFLAANGWQAGQPIAVRASMRAPVPGAWIDAGIRPTLGVDEIRRSGVNAGELASDARVALIDLVTPGARTEYWWGYENFYVITRYNRSSFYAMAVYQLSDAIARARGKAPA